MMTIYYAFCFFIFGTVLGSFYNVVGYRLPKGESLLYPSSHCTNCNHKLMPWELVPIFSFLFLGGNEYDSLGRTQSQRPDRPGDRRR